MSGGDVAIRPSTAVRLYMVLFGLAWGGLLGAGLVVGLLDGPSPVMVVPLGMLVAGGLVVCSNLSMHVIADGDVLLIRNALRQERYERASIDRFVEHTGAGGMPALGGHVAVTLVDGRLIVLRATWSGPFGRAKRAEHLGLLRSWLHRGEEVAGTA